MEIRSDGNRPLWYRLIICDGEAQTTKIPLDPDTDWNFRGMHATDLPGALGILETKELRKMRFSGVYCMASLNPKNFPEFWETCIKVLGRQRDRAGVVFELACHGNLMRLERGGTTAEDEWLQKGFITHLRTSSEDRWCVPQDRITLHAVWVTEASMEGMTPVSFIKL